MMKERVKQILSQRETKRVNATGLTSSAVLVPFFKKDGEWHLLLTKRTDTVENHKGQISFPGGRKDESDRDLLETALREGFEEVGLDPEAVEVLGELDEERTINSNFIMHPFLAVIPYPYDFKLSEQEVKELVEIPVSVLMDESNFQEEATTHEGETIPAYFYHYEDRVVWGATARILKKTLDILQVLY